MNNTRTQFRAVCPICFAQQAVTAKGGKLAQHGYTRPQQWHSNEGTCSGAGRAHFGTEAGRQVTADYVERLRASAVTFDQQADEVLAGTGTVYGTKRVAARLIMQVKVENPTDRERAQYASQLRRSAEGNRAGVKELEARIAAWQAAAPVEVTVEKSTGPLMHWSGGHWRGGKACASSYMGAQKGYATSNRDKVTCEKCKQTRQWQEGQ